MEFWNLFSFTCVTEVGQVKLQTQRNKSDFLAVCLLGVWMNKSKWSKSILVQWLKQRTDDDRKLSLDYVRCFSKVDGFNNNHLKARFYVIPHLSLIKYCWIIWRWFISWSMSEGSINEYVLLVEIADNWRDSYISMLIITALCFYLFIHLVKHAIFTIINNTWTSERY